MGVLAGHITGVIYGPGCMGKEVGQKLDKFNWVKVERRLCLWEP